LTEPPPAFFEKIVERSGLSRIFAAGVVRRACAHAQIDPARVRPSELPRLLPHLRVALSVYLPDDQVTRRLAQIAALSGPDGAGGGGSSPTAPPEGDAVGRLRTGLPEAPGARAGRPRKGRLGANDRSMTRCGKG
jgi:hypothetical protein